MKNSSETQHKQPSSKQGYGQYFTPEIVASFMLDLVQTSSVVKRVLEPCSGEGVFIRILQKRGYHDITACEIDAGLAATIDSVRCESFVSAQFDRKFDLIIGNPPYIRWANLEAELKAELALHHLWQRYCNSLCDYLSIFLLKSVELLAEDGELVFICPEYWFSTTHAQSIRDFMLERGHFEEIYHFCETPIFSQVSISTVIFRYCKRSGTPKPDFIRVIKYHARQKLTADLLQTLRKGEDIVGVEYLKVPQFKLSERWVLVTNEQQQGFRDFEEKCQKRYSVSISHQSSIDFFDTPSRQDIATIGDVCDIGNGLVSGLDKAFQVNGTRLQKSEENHTLNVIKAKDLQPFFYEKPTKYFFLPEGLTAEEFHKRFPNIAIHLEPLQHLLDARYRYNRDIPYWEWVFPRNLALFRRNEPRIFVPCKERISHKQYFRFALVEAGLYPTQDVTALLKKQTTRESLEYITAFLNNKRVFEWLRHNGIIKGNIVEFSEKPLASIPFRMIDWENEEEIRVHNDITTLCRHYIETKDQPALQAIEQQFDNLFSGSLNIPD